MDFKKDGKARTEFVLQSDLDDKGAGQLGEALKLGIRKALLERICDAAKIVEDKALTVKYFMDLSQGIKNTDLGDKMIQVGEFFTVGKRLPKDKREEAEFEIVRMSLLKCFQG